VEFLCVDDKKERFKCRRLYPVCCAEGFFDTVGDYANDVRLNKTSYVPL
jgi:hypothetical protein